MKINMLHIFLSRIVYRIPNLAAAQMGMCDKLNEPGSGSLLSHINSWGMVWQFDHLIVDASC